MQEVSVRVSYPQDFSDNGYLRSKGPTLGVFHLQFITKEMVLKQEVRMKKAVLLLAVMFAFSSLLTAQDMKKMQRFGIKSGVVKYEISGNTEGKRAVWWDDYGRKMREEISTVTITKILGMKSETVTHTVTVTVDDRFWTADLEKMTGIKGALYGTELDEEIDEMTEKEQEALGQAILDSLGGEIEGQESFMGYTCDVIRAMGSRVWVPKGINLKTESNVLGIKYYEKAVQFQPGSAVQDSFFTPYSGVEYKEFEVEGEGLDEGQAEILKGLFGN